MEQREVVREQAEVKVKVEQKSGTLRLNRNLSLSFLLLVGWLVILFPEDFDRNARAESSISQPGVKFKRSVERGRDIFHGKGSCHFCHGMDGFLDRLPPTKEDITARMARLNPPPTDLRDPSMHRLTTNKDRARAIREGHSGTSMFPNFIMTDQNMADTLFYLSFLRKDPNPE
ncbi:MAG: cytochrome c [Nitrospira sp.]|nr:cytochrome c [Nitrospira sp.]